MPPLGVLLELQRVDQGPHQPQTRPAVQEIARPLLDQQRGIEALPLVGHLDAAPVVVDVDPRLVVVVRPGVLHGVGARLVEREGDLADDVPIDAQVLEGLAAQSPDERHAAGVHRQQDGEADLHLHTAPRHRCL